MLDSSVDTCRVSAIFTRTRSMSIPGFAAGAFCGMA